MFAKLKNNLLQKKRKNDVEAIKFGMIKKSAFRIVGDWVKVFFLLSNNGVELFSVIMRKPSKMVAEMQHKY